MTKSLEHFVQEDTAQEAETRQDKLRAEISLLKAKVRGLQKQAHAQDRIVRYAELSIDALPSASPPKPLPKADKRATVESAVLLGSCWHIGETINKTEMGGLNEYNFDIFCQRLQRLVDETIDFTQHNMAMHRFDELHVIHTGDFVSGTIHQLEESNCLNIVEQATLGALVTAQALRELAQVFPKVVFTGVVGNHGRTQAKPYTKHKQQVNWDYIAYNYMALMLRNQKNIQFNIPLSFFAGVEIKGFNFHVSHGDSLRGTWGIPFYGMNRMASAWLTIGAYEKKLFQYFIWSHYHTHAQLQTALGENILNGCFPAGERVTIQDGSRVPIEDVQVGQLVLTRTGEVLPVTNTMRRSHDGAIIHFRLGSQASELHCTPNHEIWAIKRNQMDVDNVIQKGTQYIRPLHQPEPQWIPAAYLSVGDYVQMTRPTMEGVPDDENLGWYRLLGIYLAEGSASGANGALHHVDFTHHVEERDIASFVVGQCIKRWGKAVEREHQGRNVRTVAVHSSFAAREIVGLCGKGAHHKRIHPWLMAMDARAQHEILLGWIQGDGHVARKKPQSAGRYVSATSVSRTLVEQLHQIALRCGYRPAMYSQGIGGRRKSVSYTLGFFADDAEQIAHGIDKPFEVVKGHTSGAMWIGDQAFYVVKKIWREAFSGEVFNLEVDGEHSYTVNGVCVKNSIKGGCEYSLGIPAFNEPQQLLFGVHEKYGKTWTLPINTKHATGPVRYTYSRDRSLAEQDV